MIKKTIIAVLLNLVFGGVGYLYLKEDTRKPLGIFLTIVTVFEFIRNFTEGPNLGTEGNPFAILPMLSLFGGIFGTTLLVAMAVDVFFLVKRQTKKAQH
jgi:hypothetical protein